MNKSKKKTKRINKKQIETIAIGISHGYKQLELENEITCLKKEATVRLYDTQILAKNYTDALNQNMKLRDKIDHLKIAIWGLSAFFIVLSILIIFLK